MTCREEIDFQQKFQFRKTMLLKIVHLAAHFLDPYQKSKLLSPLQRIDALEFISKVAESMGLDVMNDSSNYQSCKGIWSKHFLRKNIDSVEQLKWWRL